MVSEKSLLIAHRITKQEPRRGLPHDLAHEMEDVRRKGEKVEEVAMGFDGDWFLRTDKRHGTSPPALQRAMPVSPSPWP